MEKPPLGIKEIKEALGKLFKILLTTVTLGEPLSHVHYWREAIADLGVKDVGLFNGLLSSRNCNYSSSRIKDEMLDVIAEQCMQHVYTEISDSPKLGLVCDESAMNNNSLLLLYLTLSTKEGSLFMFPFPLTCVTHTTPQHYDVTQASRKHDW